MNSRVENFVSSAHPLSYHDSFEMQCVRKRSDGGYAVVFDEYYRGRIRGTLYWAEITVQVGANGSVESYAWGNDSNFYPPYLVRKVTDKVLR